MPEKPKAKSDMMPPFERIGEPQWDHKLRSFLTSYDVPLSKPATESELDECEQRIGATLPNALRMFLAAFGPVSFDYVTILPPSEVRRPDEFFVESLPAEAKSKVNECIRVAEAGGSGDVFVVHLPTGSIHLLSHDPPSLQACLQSFDDLVRIACISIHSGFYGWDDEDVEDMTEELMDELFGNVL